MTGAAAAFPALRNHSGLLGVVVLIAVVCALGAALPVARQFRERL
jgi:hypothetical protein